MELTAAAIESDNAVSWLEAQYRQEMMRDALR